ncbi:uncharacterized protein VTP21DRAFT_6307 [Calcarisporiella thermophila]|uniref:uncharacterized protein n=1 Tax=Calcarisporiella thermophila TaxID=911321 RepID=UPI0037445CC2
MTYQLIAPLIFLGVPILVMSLLNKREPLASSLRYAKPLNGDKVGYPEDIFPGGDYVSIPNGSTKYWLFGPEDGKKIVLVHGISIPAAIYKLVGHELAKNGFRVLTYDLFGRGYSDAPKVPNDEALFVNQLFMLLHKIGWTHNVNIVGLSMGGGIAASFAQHFPDMVDRIALLAPAGLMADSEVPLLGKLVKSSLVNSTLLILNGISAVKNYIEDAILSRVRKELTPGFLAVGEGEDMAQVSELMRLLSEIMLYQLRYHTGYLRSFFSSVCHFPLVGLEDAYAALGKIPRVPVLAIWGDKDQTVPYSGAEKLTSRIKHAQLITLPEAGHIIVVTHPETVTRHLVEFFS